MTRIILVCACAPGYSLALLGAAPSMAQDEHFDIVRFQVEGNTLLPEAQAQGIVAPLAGPKRVYGDIQKALEALERAYRAAGFSTVQVFVPEQELTTGVVRLQVSEGVIGKVLISGNKHFDNANIRASLPALQEGKAPNNARVLAHAHLMHISSFVILNEAKSLLFGSRAVIPCRKPKGVHHAQ